MKPGIQTSEWTLNNTHIMAFKSEERLHDKTPSERTPLMHEGKPVVTNEVILEISHRLVKDVSLTALLYADVDHNDRFFFLFVFFDEPVVHFWDVTCSSQMFYGLVVLIKKKNHEIHFFFKINPCKLNTNQNKNIRRKKRNVSVSTGTASNKLRFLYKDV